MGAQIKLPEYLINNNNITSLHDCEDNMCFFACMALSEGCRRDRYTRRAKEIREEWEYQNPNSKYYPGIGLSELTKYEHLNDVRIHVISLKENNDFDVIRRSSFKSKKVIYLN